MQIFTGSLLHAYYFYAALLVIKLLASIPMARIVSRPEKIDRANLSDMKHLTPFWLVSGLYLTTGPDPDLAINLMRMFVLARVIASLGYMFKIVPKSLLEAAVVVSVSVNCYMGASVMYSYRNAF